MTRVVINKRRWLRGDDENSMLLRKKDNKMCCIGFLARELGCKREHIAGIGHLSEVDHNTASEFTSEYDGYLNQAYETNDDPDLTEAARIKKLREIGKNMGVRFIFK
jgi:hypothetical protein